MGWFSSFIDDTLGIDPNGGGIAGSLDNLIGTDLGLGGIQNDMYNGLTTISKELTNFADSGVDNIIATIGTVIPGPWTPFCVAYNIADNAANGNWVGAGLSAVGGYMALDAMNALGTAGATIDAAQTQAIMDAYQAAGYSTSESLNYVAQATGTSTSAVQAALNGGTLTAQGTGIIGTMQDLSNTVKDYLTSTGVTPTDSAIQNFAQTIKSDPSVLADFAEKTGTYLDASVLPEGFSPVAGVDAANTESLQSLLDKALGENYNSDLWSLTGTPVDSAEIAKILSENAANGGIGLSDIYTGLKQGKSIYDMLSSAGSAGVGALKQIMGAVTGGDLANLGAGGLSWYLANQYADKQAALANDMMNKADPYLDYRKNVEIPNRQKYAELAPTLFQNANDTASLAKNTLGDMFYQDRMKQTYTDPLSIYNSPEMQALNQQFMQGIERRDAAAGRNSQYGARAIEGQNNFLTNALPTYRTGLMQGQQGQTQQGSALGNLFSQQGQFANNVAGLGMAPSAGIGAGAEAYGKMMTESNKADTYAANPFLSALGLNMGGTSGGSGGSTPYNYANSFLGKLFNSGSSSSENSVPTSTNWAGGPDTGGYTNTYGYTGGWDTADDPNWFSNWDTSYI